MTTGIAATGLGERLLHTARTSAVPYLTALMLSAMLAAWANYLSPLAFPEGLTVKGQALSIVVPLVGFPVALVLWFVYRGRPTRNPWLIVFLAAMAVTWVAQMIILRSHGDQLTHLVWLVLPILAMVALKAPDAGEAWKVVLVFAWSAVTMLVVTRLLEMTGAVPMFRIERWIIEWEKEQYWLPLSDLLGVDGRWPGPFGYNSKTGFVATLLVLIGLARLRWHSWVFVPVGVVVILLTGGRGAALSLAAGLFVLLIFATRGPVARIPMALRAAAGAAAVVAFGIFLLLSPLATTGRFGSSGIWAAFYDLWQTSPWLGVGQVGILADPAASVSMEAHSLYLQVLTRFGVIGFAVQFATLLVALALAMWAAYRGLPWPLAILVAYFVASVTEVFQDGLVQVSFYTFLIILGAMASGSWVRAGSLQDSSRPVTGSA